jgi:hypothetical protein
MLPTQNWNYGVSSHLIEFFPAMDCVQSTQLKSHSNIIPQWYSIYSTARPYSKLLQEQEKIYYDSMHLKRTTDKAMWKQAKCHKVVYFYNHIHRDTDKHAQMYYALIALKIFHITTSYSTKTCGDLPYATCVLFPCNKIDLEIYVL